MPSELQKEEEKVLNEEHIVEFTKTNIELIFYSRVDAFIQNTDVEYITRKGDREILVLKIIS